VCHVFLVSQVILTRTISIIYIWCVIKKYVKIIISLIKLVLITVVEAVGHFVELQSINKILIMAFVETSLLGRILREN